MEKNNKTKLGAIVATVLSMTSGVSIASTNSDSKPEQQEQIKEHKFIPLEQLTPEERAKVYEKLRIISSMIEIDWESISVGVNAKGQVVLKGANSNELVPLGNPTCWAE